MANLSSYDPEVLSEVPYFDSYPNDMINQDVQEMQYYEQTHVDDFEDNEIRSGSNFILEKLIDSQMDDLIRDRNAKLAAFQQEIDTLKETLSNNVKEKESLSKTLFIFKTESKEKESKYIDKEIVLEKQNKELENIIFLKDTFNAFDETLLDEKTEVQTIFNQMEAAVDQCSVDKNIFEIQINQLRIDNDQLWNQIMSQEIMHIVTNSMDMFDVKKSCVNDCSKCLELETELLKKKDFIEKEAYDKLSFENSDLNAQLQEKVFAITALKNELTKLKGKNVVNTAVLKPNATFATGMFKVDIEPISPRLKNNRDAHEVYIEKTIEYTDTLCGFIESARTQNPSEPLLESACMFTKHVQELLVYVSQTCHSSLKPSGKQADSLKTKDSNKPLLTSTGVKPTTSASGSKPSGNTKNNSITRPPRSNLKNKVEDHSRNVKSSLNKMNCVSKPISNALVKHSIRNAKFESICAIYNKCFPDRPMVSGLRLFKTYNREPLSAHELRSRDTNVYTISLDDMLNSSPICLLSKALKTNSWLWHRYLSYLNFGTLNKLAKDGLARVHAQIRRIFLDGYGVLDVRTLIFKCLRLSSRMRNCKKSSHQPKDEDTNQEKFYLLHMDLCGPMHMESINYKKYILVIVFDYSRFTWVRFLRSKDEAPDAIIKCIKNIHVSLNATLWNVRTDNGTEFVNQTLREFYENVGISHQTSVTRTLQQNGIIER
ncbi:retrovirus-related pol polyprotein from transposon TNT 1-94 [Tanacetum coccineum]